MTDYHRRHPRPTPITGTTLAALLLLTAMVLPAHARQVHILSQSRLECVGHQEQHALVLDARLLDDHGQPLLGKELVLSVNKRSVGIQKTRRSGRAQWSLSDAELLRDMDNKKSLQIAVTFAGDRENGAVTRRLEIDPSRVLVQLRVTVVPRVCRAEQRPRVLLLLRGPDGPLPGMPLRITIGDRDWHTTTQANGQASLNISPTPSPGEYAVEAHFPGTSTHNATSARSRLTVGQSTRVALDSARWSPAGDSLTVTGTFWVDGERQPGTVALLLDGQNIAHVQAELDGQFQVDLDMTEEIQERGPRTALLRAITIPAEIWQEPSVSPGLTVHIPAPPPISPWLYLGPLLLGLLGWLLYALKRASSWKRLQAWWRLRGTPEIHRPRSDRLARGPLVRLPPAINRKGPVGAPSFVIAGHVVDAQRGRPVPDCRMEWMLSGDTQSEAVRTGQQGEFRLQWTNKGPTQATVHLTCPGYRDETIPVTLPHTGGWHRATIRLTPLRALAQVAFQQEIQAHSQTWRLGIHSPRWVSEQIAALRPDLHAPVARVIHPYERLAFGPKDAESHPVHRAFFERLERLQQARRDGNTP